MIQRDTGADGVLITWTTPNVPDDSYARILRFQSLQETLGRACLRLVRARDGDRLLGTLNAKLDRRLHLEVKVVESLPVTDLGEAIYVDQRIRRLQAAVHETSNPKTTAPSD